MMILAIFGQSAFGEHQAGLMRDTEIGAPITDQDGRRWGRRMAFAGACTRGAACMGKWMREGPAVMAKRHQLVGLDVTDLANPLQHMSRTPARPAKPPPALGQDTREVLCGTLHMAEADLATLIADGVIGISD